MELEAVMLALHHWAPVLQGLQVMIATDNTMVVSISTRGDGLTPTASSSENLPVASVSGHIAIKALSAKSTINHRMESPSRDRN